MKTLLLALTFCVAGVCTAQAREVADLSDSALGAIHDMLSDAVNEAIARQAATNPNGATCDWDGKIIVPCHLYHGELRCSRTHFLKVQ